jgi:hypothetical protein
MRSSSVGQPHLVRAFYGFNSCKNAEGKHEQKKGGELEAGEERDTL